MTRAEVEKLLELPVEERVELAERLLDSLPAGPIPAWHLKILRQRLENANVDPEAAIPWEQVEAELWPPR